MSVRSYSLSLWGEGWDEGRGLCKHAAFAVAVDPHPSPLPKGRGSNSRAPSGHPRAEVNQ
ncbi:hypothetical protein M2282_000375 [Variovorax boronicumulans]|nr:hypothetical protein [Variovorax boronicumulans]